MTLQELTIGLLLGTFWGLMIYVGFALPIEASDITQTIAKQNKDYSESKAKQYLMKNLLTEHQANYVLSQLDKVENKDHFIARFGAIFRHENGKEFVNWETMRLAGRLKQWMQYKPFWVQFDGRLDQYNRTRYKNNTVNDWIYKSSYCVTDSHWGNGKGCPNWQRNVGAIVESYGLSKTSPQKQANNWGKIYPVARQKQDEADKLWEACLLIWECKH